LKLPREAKAGENSLAAASMVAVKASGRAAVLVARQPLGRGSLVIGTRSFVKVRLW
jgi:hypothetical protein